MSISFSIGFGIATFVVFTMLVGSSIIGLFIGFVVGLGTYSKFRSTAGEAVIRVP